MLRISGANLKVPDVITRNSEKINKTLATISLIGLTALAYSIRPQHFIVAAGAGAVWQLGLNILKVKRSHSDEGCESEMGCVDGYSKWFIGRRPLHIEKIMGATTLAAEHMLHHNKYVTFSNFLAVCMGIRAVIMAGEFLSGKTHAHSEKKACHKAHTH